MAGTMITINGSNFTGASNVMIGGQTATFTVVSPTQITATVPAGATGTNLSVTTGAGTGNTVGFAPAPTITGFSPANAAPGASVTLTGTNFIAGAVQTVVIGGQAATFTVVSPTQITATVPAGATGNGATVTTVSGVGNNAGFAVNIAPPPAPPPTPAPPVAPNTFQLGATPTLQASLNLPYGLMVVANGSPAPTYSFVTGTLPPGVSFSPNGMLTGTPARQGTYTFTVEARNSAGSALSVITFVVGAPRPLATAISTNNGSIGSIIVIRGYNFLGATRVRFGGVDAMRFTVDDNGQITAIVGAGNSGLVEVSTPEGTTTAPDEFRYTAPETPVISGFAPPVVFSGDDDYSLTVRGKNLSAFATYLVQPETGTSASFAVPLPVVVESVNAEAAYLRLPLASRTIGVKRLMVRIGNEIVSATFAVVPGAMPQITSLTVASTMASSQAFTTELVGRNFFRRGFATITVNGQAAKAGVLDSNRARVEIPATLNIVGSRVLVRLTNYDGQFAESVVNVVSRIAPLVLRVTSRLDNRQIRMTIQGSGFWGVQRVTIQNRLVTLVRTSPSEMEILLPSDFPRPSLTEEAWVLMIENPDGQMYGFRLATSLFYPTSAASAGFSTQSSSNVSPKNAAETSSGMNTAAESESTSIQAQGLGMYPNPASDMVSITGLPQKQGMVRLTIVNSIGAVVLEQELHLSTDAVSLDVHSLVQGAYTLVVRSGTEQRGVRFVKR
jgi:hypothetical protein